MAEQGTDAPNFAGRTATAAGWIRIVRWLVAVAVVVALALTIWKSLEQLRTSPIRLGDLSAEKLAVAWFCCVAAMMLSAIFWKFVLVCFGVDRSWLESLRAFATSQLGKYVPGKAMVVVIRTNSIANSRQDIGPVAASVFVETLTWIFVGAMIASVLVALRMSDHLTLSAAAISVAILFGVLTSPPVVSLVGKRFGRVSWSESPIGRYGWNAALLGWLLLGIGWSLSGLALWLILNSIPGSGADAADYPLALATVTLAMVVGFVSLLPGGLGVRELVMLPLLGSQFGIDVALVAAVLMRLVWLAAELVCAAAFEIAGHLRDKR